MAPARQSSAWPGQAARPRAAHSPPWRNTEGLGDAQEPSPHGMDAAALACHVATACGRFGGIGPNPQRQLQGESKAQRSHSGSPAKCRCGRDRLNSPGPGDEGACSCASGSEDGAASGTCESRPAGSSPRDGDAGPRAGSRKPSHGASRSIDFQEDHAQAQRRLAFLGPNYWAWGHGFTDWARENKVRGRWDALVRAQSPPSTGSAAKACALNLFTPAFASPPQASDTDRMQQGTQQKDGSLRLAQLDSLSLAEGTCTAADLNGHVSDLERTQLPAPEGSALSPQTEGPIALAPKDAGPISVLVKGSDQAAGAAHCSLGASIERELSFGDQDMAAVTQDLLADEFSNLKVPVFEATSAAQTGSPGALAQRRHQVRAPQASAGALVQPPHRVPRATRNIRVTVPLSVDGLLSPRHQRRAGLASAQGISVQAAPALTSHQGQSPRTPDLHRPVQRILGQVQAGGDALPHASSSPDLSADAQRWVQRWVDPSTRVDPSASPSPVRRQRVPRGERGIRLRSWGAKALSVDTLVQVPEQGLDEGTHGWQSRAIGFLTPQPRGIVGPTRQEASFPWSPEAQAVGSGENSPLKSSLKGASSPRLWAMGERSSRKVQFNDTQAVRFIPSRKELRRLEERAQASSEKDGDTGEKS